MAKVKIQGHASGTGVLTVTAPNTSTDRTITLPDATGTLLNSDGSGANLTNLPNGSQLDHSGTKKIEATATGVSVTGASYSTSNIGLNVNNFLGFSDNSFGRLVVNDTEICRVLSTGGITFNGDTAAANALDDYEEGTHTVTATCSTSGSITLNSTNNKFTYTKIGNLVTITGRLDVSAISSPNGDLSFSLPFTVAQTGSSQNQSTAGAIFVWYPTSGDSGKWVAWADGGESKVYVRHGDGVQPPQSANLARVSTEFRLNFSYTTA